MGATLINERTGEAVALTVELADTRRARRKGLLGRASMRAGEAMVITPCKAVHTAFMRFAIDVVFVDGGGRAVEIVENLRPWRIAASLRAHAVIEMAAGSASAVRIGDRLSLNAE